ncbi:MAG: RloB family protein [Ferruginibacter sp.]
MARKQKIDNSILRKFERKEKIREVGNREPKVYFLVVCEGEKTEPNYFNALKNELPSNTLDVNIIGTGYNTLGLVEKAIIEKNKANKKYDSVWVVFDKDSFLKDSFDNAINKANSNGIKCAWSNEAFELWYLLHFQFVSNKMTREYYKSFLEREFKNAGLNDFEYEKKSTNLYLLLSKYGNEKQAIENAKKLREMHVGTNFSNHNPCTYVDILIYELRNPLSLL